MDLKNTNVVKFFWLNNNLTMLKNTPKFTKEQNPNLDRLDLNESHIFMTSCKSWIPTTKIRIIVNFNSTNKVEIGWWIKGRQLSKSLCFFLVFSIVTPLQIWYQNNTIKIFQLESRSNRSYLYETNFQLLKFC